MKEKDYWTQDDYTDSHGITHHGNGTTSYNKDGIDYFDDGSTLQKKGDFWYDQDGTPYIVKSNGQLRRYYN